MATLKDEMVMFTNPETDGTTRVSGDVTGYVCLVPNPLSLTLTSAVIGGRRPEGHPT